MKINVTAQDIQQGQKRDPEQCAVARALLRAGLNHSGVMGPSVMVSDAWGRLISLPLPTAVSDWIFNFDAGKAVRPSSFEMDVAAKPASSPLPPVFSTAEAPQSLPEPKLSLLSLDDLNSVARIRCNSRCKRPALPRKRSRLCLKTRRSKRVPLASL